MSALCSFLKGIKGLGVVDHLITCFVYGQCMDNVWTDIGLHIGLHMYNTYVIDKTDKVKNKNSDNQFVYYCGLH